MHILNHVISARRIVVNTNRRLRRLAREQGDIRTTRQADREKGRATKKKTGKVTSKNLMQGQENDIRQDVSSIPIHIGGDDDGDKWDWKRDQGFTRPTVLVLCPLR